MKETHEENQYCEKMEQIIENSGFIEFSNLDYDSDEL